MRIIKFEILVRNKIDGDEYTDILTLDDLLNRNGCLYNPQVQKIVWKRQFTGLLDKNGKEIWEGDRCSFRLAHHTHGSHHLDVREGVVKWDNEDTGFYLETMCGHIPYVKTYYAINLEVIGNIYEHSHLLDKGEK